MRERCNNPNKDNYSYYGGRGITVAPEWDSFWKFVEDMGPKPDPSYQLDRVDSNGSYCKSNCRWVSARDNQNNRPTYNVTVTYNGRTQSIAQWARECGLRYRTLYHRINRGWELERALTWPAKSKKTPTALVTP
jgi:hypothetical protein